MDDDFALALQLQSELFDDNVDCTPEKSKVDNANGKPMSLVDPYWEVTDPNPDVRALFLQFNDRFFWGRLAGIEVRWSPRMTLCAGLCCYEGRGGLCSVRLSVPLLKLRPRKDLVETLLHEMIHAYLFVTDNNKDHDGHGPEFHKHMYRINGEAGTSISDHDGHGPEFHKHMYRINGEAGTSISVYHNFHDEVDAYRQHWWRCDGPCRSRKPYFGYVKRSMNRAPSKNDNWWAEHERSCGGRYTKVKEPEGYGKKKGQKKEGEEKKDGEEKGKLKSKGKPPVKSMDIRVFGGEGKTLGQPKISSASNNSGNSKFPASKTNSGSSKTTATVTSGVMDKSKGLVGGDRRFGTSTKPPTSPNKPSAKPPTSPNKPSATVTSGVLHRDNSDVVSLSSDEDSSIPGCKTPTSKKGGKKGKGSFKPVSQGGSATFDKIKKKKFVALDFSDSEDDDEMCRLEEISTKEKNRVFGSGEDDMNTGEDSFSKHEFDTEDDELWFDAVDTDSISEVQNGIGVEDQKKNAGESDSVTETRHDAVDTSDVRAMLRKVWGERQFSQVGTSSKEGLQAGPQGRPRPALTPLDQVRPHFQPASGGLDISSRSSSVKRPSTDGDGSLQRKKKKTSGTDGQYMIHSASGGTDTGSPDKITGAKTKGAEMVTSPIDNFFKKMEEKKKNVNITDPVGNSHGNSSPHNPTGDKSNSIEGDNPTTADSSHAAELAPCPVCCKNVPANTINDHLDLCLTLQAIS